MRYVPRWQNITTNIKKNQYNWSFWKLWLIILRLRQWFNKFLSFSLACQFLNYAVVALSICFLKISLCSTDVALVHPMIYLCLHIVLCKISSNIHMWITFHIIQSDLKSSSNITKLERLYYTLVHILKRSWPGALSKTISVKNLNSLIFKQF